jgi:hypothetical protein
MASERFSSIHAIAVPDSAHGVSEAIYLGLPLAGSWPEFFDPKNLVPAANAISSTRLIVLWDKLR